MGCLDSGGVRLNTTTLYKLVIHWGTGTGHKLISSYVSGIQVIWNNEGVLIESVFNVVTYYF